MSQLDKLKKYKEKLTKDRQRFLVRNLKNSEGYDRQMQWFAKELAITEERIWNQALRDYQARMKT